MKSLSASIIVLGGVACLHVAREFDSRSNGLLEFVMIIGTILIGLGMFGWFWTLREP